MEHAELDEIVDRSYSCTMGRTSDAKQRLIDSAARLMHERGYTAVGVSQVCSDAGVNKGSFYYFFPSKQELAEAVIVDHWNRYFPALEKLSTGPEPPLVRLRTFFEDRISDHRGCQKSCGKILGCPFGNLVLELSNQDIVLRDVLRGYFDRMVDSFQKALDQAVSLGHLPSQDTLDAARSVIALLQGELLLAKVNDDPGLLENLSEKALRLVRAPRAA